MKSAGASLYRILKRAGGPAPVRPIVIAFVIAATSLTAVGLVRVSRQHEVLRIGYQLERESDRARQLRETQRRLEVERATLTSPVRIRKLASQLGMTTVSADRIRILDVPRRNKVAIQ